MHFEKLPPLKWRLGVSTLAQLFGVEKVRPCPETVSPPYLLILFLLHLPTTFAPVGFSQCFPPPRVGEKIVSVLKHSRPPKLIPLSPQAHSEDMEKWSFFVTNNALNLVTEFRKESNGTKKLSKWG